MDKNQNTQDAVHDVLSTLPEQLRSILRQRIEGNPRISRLQRELKAAQKQFSITRVITLDRQLREAIDQTVSDAIREYEYEALTIDKVFRTMDKEDCHRACYLFVALFLLTDMVESTLMDLDSLCKKVNPDYHFEIGRDLLASLKLSRTKMAVFSKNFPFFHYDKWGDEADRLYNQTVTRAGILVRAVFRAEAKKENEKEKKKNGKK